MGLFKIFLNIDTLQGSTLQTNVLLILVLAYNKLMPRRNVVKKDCVNSFYHVYARGHAHMVVFRDEIDYSVMLNIIKRHLSKETEKDRYNRFFVNLSDTVEINCYCLMPNHIHFLIYQIEESSMAKLMKCTLSSYCKYFNKKYGLSGAVFETTYKAVRVESEDYLLHISRYIHLNPINWRSYEYSSFKYYLGQKSPNWIKTTRILELFVNREEYSKFVEGYAKHKSDLNDMKLILANAD